MVMHKLFTLRRVNYCLAGLLILLALYIMVLPIFPSIQWWVRHSAPVISSPTVTSVPLATVKIPDGEILYIPSLNLSEPIFEGASIYTANKGIWRRPQTSSPDQGSNTVLVGHRFTYAGAAVFYNLDKVKSGDQIIVYWHGKAYEYKVFNISQVSPNKASVEAPTNESILTLYTCTPLLTAKDRLVIQAVLENVL